jgi:hypothetical protein
MPTYTFINKKTQEISEHVMKISEYDDFLKKNTHLQRHFVADNPALVSRVEIGKNSKPSEGFRDLLKQIKKSNRGSDFNTF